MRKAVLSRIVLTHPPETSSWKGWRHIALLMFLFALALVPQADATIVVPLSEEALIDDAAAIITGHVTAIRGNSDQNQGIIFTNVTVAIEDVLKGELFVSEITLRQPGGSSGNVHSWLEGSPGFRVGEKVLLFLRLDREGNLRVAHLYQGKFSVSRDVRSGQEYATRGTPPGVRIMGNFSSAGNQRSTQNEFHRLRDLTDRIQRHLNNSSGQPSRQRLPLSFIPGNPTGTTLGALRESFAFLGYARWFEPDSGIPISMKINAAGEPLAPTNGFEQVRAAFQAWSSVPESTFRYQDGGFTDAVGGRYDGVNAVSFRDPLGQMDSPVNCSGTLAVGGFIYTTSQARTINGTTFWRIVDGDLVFNDGWDGCGFFYENFANFTEVATHELGHVLGLDHSSDPSATMYDRAHFDGRGASLGQDDINGLKAIYPNETPRIGGATFVQSIDPAWKVVASADFNADGHPDLLWQHETTGAVVAWYLSGTTHIGGATVLQTIDPLWKVVGASDFNADGHPDLLWQHETTGAVVAWYLSGLR